MLQCTSHYSHCIAHCTVFKCRVQKGRFMQRRRAVFICLCPLHRLWSFHREHHLTFEHRVCFKMFRFQLLSLHRLWSFHGAAKHLLAQIGEIQMFNTFELGSVLSVYILHRLWSFHRETFEHWVCFKMFRFPFLFLHRLWSFHREQLSICLLRMFNTFEHRNLDLF